MASIHTNKAALQALRAINDAAAELAAAQGRVSTGLSVAGPKDNAAVYTIAQNMRAETGGWRAVGQSLARGQSALEVAVSAVEAISSVLLSLNERAAALQDPSLSAASRQALRQEIDALVNQIDEQAKLATFDGLNFLANAGAPRMVGRSVGQSYSLPSSALTPQSFLTPMAMVSAETTLHRGMTTTAPYQAPTSSLTPRAFSQPLQSVAGGTSVLRNYSTIGGDYLISPLPPENRPGYPARYDLLFDAFAEGAAIEVWSNGMRVAATGQPYSPGGGAVAGGSTVTGPGRLSFDYDPAQSYEVRTIGGAGWARFSDSGFRPAASGLSSPPAHRTVTAVSHAAPGSPPAEPLTLETSGSPPSGGSTTHVIDGGAHSGRVDFIFDAAFDADVVEVWQDGQRIAASGQPYASGGGPVAAGVPVSGQHVISFDYDASRPHALEFRFNEHHAAPNASWIVGGMTLQDPAQPPPLLLSPQWSQSVTAATSQDTRELAGPLDPLTPETDAQTSGTASYVIDAGVHAGRVDLAFDAFEAGDVIEVWQSGVRVAASGQAYASGGGAVAAGVPVSGQALIHFDYDPAQGQSLEFRINSGRVATNSAWVVGGLVLQPTGAPLPSALPAPSTGSVLGVTYPRYGFVGSPQGDRVEVEARDLTAVGLRLNALDWNNPDAVRSAVQSAIDRVTEAAGHFGAQQSSFAQALAQTHKLSDTLEAGVGNLVDADMAREAAKLQAAKVRQQLAAHALQIANAEPQWLLSLFRKDGA